MLQKIKYVDGVNFPTLSGGSTMNQVVHISALTYTKGPQSYSTRSSSPLNFPIHSLIPPVIM